VAERGNVSAGISAVSISFSNLRRLASFSMRSRPGPSVSALGAADAGVAVNLDHFPASVRGDLAEFMDLVLDRLVVGADSHVQCSPLRLGLRRRYSRRVFRSPSIMEARDSLLLCARMSSAIPSSSCVCLCPKCRGNP
jgi:hypothetical protein